MTIDYDYPDVSLNIYPADKLSVARKPHECYGCGTTISKGDKFLRCMVVEKVDGEGTPENACLCTHCLHDGWNGAHFSKNGERVILYDYLRQ